MPDDVIEINVYTLTSHNKYNLPQILSPISNLEFLDYMHEFSYSILGTKLQTLLRRYRNPNIQSSMKMWGDYNAIRSTF